MYTTKQLTSAIAVLDNWQFFRKGLTLCGNTNYEQMLKVFCYLAGTNRGFVAIVGDDIQPIGFGVMENVTPIFTSHGQFLCRAFYHKGGNLSATLCLMEFFEKWAREQQVDSYSVTTERQSGAAIRCFKSEKYGFKRSFVQFVKQLN